MTDLQKISDTTDAPWHRSTVATLLRQQTSVTFRAYGPSMNPTIRNGDLICVQPIKTRPLRRGDIVLFRQADRLTLHRYVKRVRGHAAIGATGDAALEGVEIVAVSDLCGIASSLIRNEQCIRLETPQRRWLGLLRYSIRPVRRVAHKLRSFKRGPKRCPASSSRLHPPSTQRGAR